MRAAVANSNGVCLSPLFVSGKDVRVSDTLARFGHHVLDGVSPSPIVWGFLVSSRVFSRPVDLNQHEARRVIHLLYDIKTGDTGLFDALRGVLKRCSAKSLYRFGSNVHMDMNDEHFEHAVF